MTTPTTRPSDADRARHDEAAVRCRTPVWLTGTHVAGSCDQKAVIVCDTCQEAVCRTHGTIVELTATCASCRLGTARVDEEVRRLMAIPMAPRARVALDAYLRAFPLRFSGRNADAFELLILVGRLWTNAYNEGHGDGWALAQEANGR